MGSKNLKGNTRKSFLM